MRDRGGFPRAPLVALATFTAAGGASVHAQMPLPSAAKPSGAELFAQQCATCHSLSPADAPRQGPALAGIYGRKAGSVAGFHYSPGYGEADFVWDEAHLDSYLTDPQAVIPGAVMLYKQKNADVRKAIIAFLKEQK
jgi:cytochrome c